MMNSSKNGVMQSVKDKHSNQLNNNEYIIQEHGKIPYDSNSLKKWGEGMSLHSQKNGLNRWFFQWRRPLKTDDNSNSSEEISGSGYYASYVIGAQWLNDEYTMPLVVTTKDGCNRIDFLRMFSTCFNSGIESEEFSKIYDINIEKPKIKAPELDSVLSPLIVVHFLSIVKEIVKHGLKKDYINRECNLNKVKGHIMIYRNERTNILKKRYDKVYCKFQEYSANTPENRLLKKALIFSRQILQNLPISNGLQDLQQRVNSYLSIFGDVDDQIEIWEVKSIKRNKIFKEYNEAIRLAQMILRRYDYNITNITPAEDEYCPVFWIDMSLLYEHYVLGLLREAYGNKITYQTRGHTGYPDFICHDPDVVMDTKYIPSIDENNIKVDIVRQLCGYARDTTLFTTKPTENIPCIVIYPKEGESINLNPFMEKSIEELMIKENEYGNIWEFYRIAVPLPILPQEIMNNYFTAQH